MSFLEVLWGLIKMWELWLCLIIVLVAGVTTTFVGSYIATFSPVLALAFGAVAMLLIVTTVIWVADNAS